jgi:tRNA threonylcarbamoyladenosine biosynthesis protein TsaB
LDSLGNHSRDLLPVVESLLEGVKPDALGIALGPGSFTGVRIGLACAKGLAQGWDIPLVGLDNLQAMAAAWSWLAPQSEAAVLPVIDARKKKFYGALYHGQTLIPPSDLSPQAWIDEARRIWSGPVVLSGYQGAVLAQAVSLPDSWSVLPTRDWTVGLLDQLEEGWLNKAFLAPDASPRYLRLSEAEENLRRRSI